MRNIPTHTSGREALFNLLEDLISSYKKNEKKFAVLLININNFRELNTSYGYKLADKLLDQFAERLAELLHQPDYITQIGNSDFVMILPGILNEGHATLAALKLQEILSESFNLDSQEYKVSVDIGITLFPDHATEIESLLQAAEVALSEARNSTSSYAVYSEKTKPNEFNTWDIETKLQKALNNHEFELYFQPQISIQSGIVFGAEALIRWKDEERGFIRPDIFIPVAENNGQIYEITQWTINSALRLINEWPDIGDTPLKVAINLSAKVLNDPDIVDSISSAMTIWGTDRERLILEITESALMDDMSTSFKTLNELKALGLTISIDDFGTGYSSMSYFKNIPASELKIDQSFIFNMLESKMDRHIVKTVIHMGHGFDLKVVAEGIENKETYDALKDMGCDIAQGYYLARPMPQKEFIEWINNYQPQKN